MAMTHHFPTSVTKGFGQWLPQILSTQTLFGGLAMSITAVVATAVYESQCGGNLIKELTSHLLSRTSLGTVVPPEVTRSHFTDLPLPLTRVRADHTHGNCAAERNSASAFIDSLSAILGKTAYFIQRSRSDERNSRSGSRSYYWVKDLNASPAVFAPPDNSLSVFVDVDQFVDMPSFLTSHFVPTILYTFQPEQVARDEGEYSFTFDADNNVHYLVSGGGLYVHKVWNYSRDHIRLSRTFCGITYSMACYFIDRRRTGPDHELVMLTPVRKWTGIWAFLASFNIEGRPLERLEPAVNPDFLRLNVVKPSGLHVSTGRVGAYSQSCIRASYDDEIAAVSRTSKYPLTEAQVQSQSRKKFKDGLPLLLEFHRKCAGAKAAVVCPIADSIVRYEFDVDHFTPEAKCTVVPFMNPIVTGCYSPYRTKGNEEHAVETRVNAVRPDNAALQSTPFLIKCMEEFLEFLIPDPGQLHPVSAEEVRNRQSRPSQRRIIEDAEFRDPDDVVKSFMKCESYSGPNDPRLISTIDGVRKVSYSAVMYAAADVLKSAEWYAFGKTPLEIAFRVAAILRDKTRAVNTDFSRFDGRLSQILRDLELMFLLRAFRSCYHVRLDELHKSQYNLKAFATFGTMYETGTARASGSPETACFNSLANGFVAYLTRRLSHVPPSVAYSS